MPNTPLYIPERQRVFVKLDGNIFRCTWGDTVRLCKSFKLVLRSCETNIGIGNIHLNNLRADNRPVVSDSNSYLEGNGLIVG